MTTIILTAEEALDLVEEKDAVLLKIEKWRHGTRDTYIVPKDGKFWKFTVRCHSSEGWDQDGNDKFTATQVEPVDEMKMVRDWKEIQ